MRASRSLLLCFALLPACAALAAEPQPRALDAQGGRKKEPARLGDKPFASGGGESGQQGSAAGNNIGLGAESVSLEGQLDSVRRGVEKVNRSGVDTSRLQPYLDQLMETQKAAELPEEKKDRSITYSRPPGYDNIVGAAPPSGRAAAPRRARGSETVPVDLGAGQTAPPLRRPEGGPLSASSPSGAAPVRFTANAPPAAEESGAFRGLERLLSGARERGGRSPARGAGLETRALLRSARALLRARDLAGAEESARAALALEPESPAALALLAQIRLEQGRYEEAVGLSDEALRRDGTDADAFFVRAMAHEQLGREAAKAADLRKAAQLAPGRFSRQLERAREGGRLFDPSVGDSWRLIDQDPSEPDPRAGAPWTLLLGLGSLAALLGAAALAGRRLRRRGGPRTAEPEEPAAPAGIWAWAERMRRPGGREAGAGRRTPIPSPLERGTLIGDKYRLVRQIGVDGMVEIWKALDRTLDRNAIMQRLYAGPGRTEERARRLEDARSAATLHHPNVMDVYEILDVDDGLFMVYEYATGKSVRRILREKGPLGPAQVRDILIPVCRALEHAHHRGVVHGGLSPERLLVTQQGYVKVSNFVLARTTGVGSERYAAPEAKRGEPLPVSDVYSLALCCCEMLTGELPAAGTVEVDGRIAALLEPCLDLDFRTRTPSARELLKILEKLAGPAAAQEPAA